MTAASAVRLDSSLAGYQNAKGQGGFTLVSELLGAFRIPGTGSMPGTGLAPLVKLTLVDDSPPGGTAGGVAVVNPLLGATYGLTFGGGFRGSAFLGVTIPIGMGGGNSPNPGEADARTAGQNARLMLDNSLFAVDDVAIIPGIDLAFVKHGFTAQVEATLFQLERVRGEAAQQEAKKTNFTAGAYLGYFVLDVLSVGAELRYQRWIDAPLAIDQHKTGSEDQLSFGVGPRLNLRASRGVWIRPGIAYSRGFDHPLTSPGNDNVVQIDVPVVF